MVINLEKRLESVLGFVNDPERFLRERRGTAAVPTGFRLEIYAAQRFAAACDVLRQFSDTYLGRTEHCFAKGDGTDFVPLARLRAIVGNVAKNRGKKKTFCQYCEKAVVPRRLHKLDAGDIVLALFTGGFWLIFIFVVYMFLRRCPVCNNSLRGMKSNHRKRALPD